MNQSGWEQDVQDVTGLDNQTPASPDGTGGHQGTVLGQRQLLSWTVEVGDTGDDKSPLFGEISHVRSLPSQHAIFPHFQHNPVVQQ